ncbi:hypothetical protein AGMMS4956_12780 [Bacteroidia bacterium]|nr:hypothetical protein AGMMS4956_12780 [Bacteroidia bacterium]
MLHYSPEVGKHNLLLGLGGGGGLSYTFFFNRNWGLSLGAEAMLYTARYTATLQGYYDAYDDEDFVFYYKFTKFTERQHLLTLNVPLMVRFQTPIDYTKDFYVALGGKMGLPISAGYNSTADQIVTFGNYEYDNSNLQAPKFMAFGTHQVKPKGILTFDRAFMASAEVGVKWQLNQQRVLYTGVYADYGINNIHQPDKLSRLVDYFQVIEYYNTTIPSDLMGSVLNATHSDATHNNVAIAKKVVPLAVGIKITLAVGRLAKRKPSRGTFTDCYCPLNER